MEITKTEPVLTVDPQDNMSGPCNLEPILPGNCLSSLRRVVPWREQQAKVPGWLTALQFLQDLDRPRPPEPDTLSGNRVVRPGSVLMIHVQIGRGRIVLQGLRNLATLIRKGIQGFGTLGKLPLGLMKGSRALQTARQVTVSQGALTGNVRL